jgi:hypothetical protein
MQRYGNAMAPHTAEESYYGARGFAARATSGTPALFCLCEFLALVRLSTRVSPAHHGFSTCPTVR